MRERPILFSGPMVRALLDGRKTQTRRVVKPRYDWSMDEQADGSPWPYFEPYVYAEPDPVAVPCPYGVPGDRLWVRETLTRSGGYVQYAADTKTSRVMWPVEWKRDARPSIHMPRWASRLTLELTGVRVERVQDISHWDARQEGFDDTPELGPRQHFIGTWISLNGLESWQSNPWVWALDFTVAAGVGR